MSRFRPAIALAILLTLLALPASAVPSSRTNLNSAGGFFSALWNAITALVSTDGRCGLDPWGCPPGNAADTPLGSTDGRCSLDPWGCPPGPAAATPLASTDGRCSLDPDGRCMPGLK